MDHKQFSCPVCNAPCALSDVVDLNKSCEEPRGFRLPLSGIPIYYALCPDCRFCFAPEMCSWPLERFETMIYNHDYRLVDPEYAEIRPGGNATTMLRLFPNLPPTVRHLDFGGGNGRLSQLLSAAGWNSLSYDPFDDRSATPDTLGTFELITAFEVFEHVPDVRHLLASLHKLSARNGIILFSTLLSDGNIEPGKRLDWWYASPRNGHISLFSRKSLALLAGKYGFQSGSFSEGFHMFFTAAPTWAAHLFPRP